MSCNFPLLATPNGMILPQKGFILKSSVGGFFKFYASLAVFFIAKSLCAFFSAAKLNIVDRGHGDVMVRNEIDGYHAESALSHTVNRIIKLKDVMLGCFCHPVLLEITYLILQ
ncbi:hypothetical protein [Mucilaginibacter sp. SG564]|uniref:hypothetical protein n=1 Tax=Mucilaginibacter sp. SG564 TaxID=2587022 RepID=UPI001555A4F3|nr:hypothetical protein [Mucilaginibacter sp. SG564]NOW96027.1 hypothetical protein [Mucilaginibacter sp. SG564]